MSHRNDLYYDESRGEHNLGERRRRRLSSFCINKSVSFGFSLTALFGSY